MNENKSYYPGLDIIKFIAAIIILLHHYYLNTQLEQLSFTKDGSIAVELFFMISGFLHGGGQKRKSIKKLQYRDYILKVAKRFVAIAFVTVFVYAITGILYYLTFGEWYRQVSIDIWGFLTSLFLIFAGGAVGNVTLGVNNPIWYLCVLLICHSLFYVIARTFDKKKIPICYGYLGMVLIGLAATTYGFSLPFFNGMVSRGYYCFFLGCIIAVVMERIDKKQGLYCMSVTMVLLYILPKLLGMDFLYNNWRLSIVFTLFPALVIIGTCSLPKWVGLCSRSFAGIGFEIYMWQGVFFIFQGWLYNVGIIKYNIETFVIFVISIIGFSVVVYLFLEKRLNRLILPYVENFANILFEGDMSI